MGVAMIVIAGAYEATLRDSYIFAKSDRRYIVADNPWSNRCAFAHGQLARQPNVCGGDTPHCQLPFSRQNSAVKYAAIDDRKEAEQCYQISATPCAKRPVPTGLAMKNWHRPTWVWIAADPAGGASMRCIYLAAGSEKTEA